MQCWHGGTRISWAASFPVPVCVPHRKLHSPMGEQDHVLHRQYLRTVHLTTLPASVSVHLNHQLCWANPFLLSCSVALSKNQMTPQSQEPHDFSQISSHLSSETGSTTCLNCLLQGAKNSSLLVETALLSEMIQIH